MIVASIYYKKEFPDGFFAIGELKFLTPLSQHQTAQGENHDEANR